MMRFLLLLCAGLILAGAVSIGAVSAQDDPGASQTAHGVIIMRDESRDTVNNAFELFGCASENCARFGELLFPTLFSVDPVFNVVRPAQAVEHVLIADPPAIPAAEQQYTIQSGLTWSDGTPITAYDAAYSIIGREVNLDPLLRTINGLRIDGETAFTVSYARPDCTSQFRLNAGILSSEYVVPGFRAFAETFMTEHDGVPNLETWVRAFERAFRGLSWVNPQPFTSTSLVDSGRFTFSGSLQAIQSTSGDLVIGGQSDPYQNAALAFIGGDTNLLLDPPQEDRVNLRNIGDALIYEAPGYAVDRLVFNLSDPYYPRSSTVDGIPGGAPLEQLPHPILSDVRVRRAIRLAIDAQALIDGALYGGGIALGGMYSPASWAFDPSLPVWEYDPIEADRLLNEAGWRGESVRRCIGCPYPELRSTLSLSLAVDEDPVRQRAAAMIQNQLARVGIDLYIDLISDSDSRQDSDLYLISSGGTSTWMRDPDFTDQLTPEYDVIGLPGGNIGSYANPTMTDLLEQARTTATCSTSERAAVYADVQRLINDDLPFTALYARNDFYIARGIAHFAPLPGEPLWNITDWVVTR